MGFKSNPFIRILIPFLSGILLSIIAGVRLDLFYPFLISFSALIVFFFISRKRVDIINTRSVIITADLFLLLAGVYVCFLNDVKNSKTFYGHFINEKKQNWVGEIKELPIEKENFYKVLVEVKTLEEREGLQGKAMLYVKKPFNIDHLKPGNNISISSRFNALKPPLNPNEFDYKRFLERKNIYYQSFTEGENVALLNGERSFSMVSTGLEIKQKIKRSFEESSLNKETAQLCVALLTGYDDEISAETINAFAHSGTLHVLSVSGLHTGILYTVLVFLLSLIDKHKRYKWFHLIVITLGLWSFVLITGFSAPVLRAAIMLNLIAIGRFYYSYSSQSAFNILAVSAFSILVFDPFLICDTGFLLSYAAVAGILYFEPLLTPLINSKYAVINKVWQLTSVSLAAQITTLPITLYLFHQFPLWFVFSNLLVIPLCTLIMFFGFLFLLKISFVGVLLNYSSSVIFYCIHLTDSPGIGYVDKIDFGRWDLLFLSLLIIMIMLFISKRKYSYCTSGMAIVIVWQIVSLFEVADKKRQSHLTIYQINKQSAIDVKNRTKVNFLASLSKSNYDYHIKNNHCYYNYPIIDSLDFDCLRSNQCLLVKLNTAQKNYFIPIVKPNYILVTDNTELEETSLIETVKMVIADGSNNYINISKLRKLCDKFAIPFYSTAEKGYLQLDL